MYHYYVIHAWMVITQWKISVYSVIRIALLAVKHQICVRPVLEMTVIFVNQLMV